MVLKCALNNICNTVMSGQGPSSSGGPLWSARKKPGRGVSLTSQSKHTLTSVRSYFEEEKRTGKSLMKNRPLDRTATATGISKAAIKRIYQRMNEDKEILQLNNTLNQELQLTLTHLTKKIYNGLYTVFMYLIFSYLHIIIIYPLIYVSYI